VLAGSTITNTGSSVINGDLGLYPGTAVTGFPPATLNGTQHVSDALAIQAKSGLTGVYTDAAGRTPVTTLITELGGSTKVAGVYDSMTGTFGITGTVTLDAQGDPNAVFIFKSASTLITASNSNVVLANGAQACNVFWLVGSSATLGSNSTLKGNVIAVTSITLTTGAQVEGRVMAQNGAVTLDGNTITRATCTVAPTPPPVVVIVTPTPTPATTTPPVIPAPVYIPVTTPGLPNTGFGTAGIVPVSTMVLSALALLSLGIVYRKKSLSR
jgi:hypothetical protein